MQALSQSLTFNVNNTSTVVLNYPNTGTTALTYLTDKVKGDGYFSNADGFHTVQVQTNNFVGKIEIQGTLNTDPSSNDWFNVELGTNSYSVDTTGLVSPTNITYVQYTTATTLIKSYNFTGNLVWVRSKISNFTEGSITSIKYNH